VFVLAVVVLVLSCGGDKKTGVDKDSAPSRTTEDGVLEAFAYYYEAMDIEGYDEVLDEMYIFQFTPDVADSLGLPPDDAWWGKAQDLASTANMFNDRTVRNIKMEYRKVDDWAAHIEVRQDTTLSGLFVRLEPNIRIVVDEGSEEPTTYHVTNSWLDVVVVPDRFNRELWCILTLEEHSKRHLTTPATAISATEGTTWGALKALWK
jgi:hypothetical protein